MLDINLSLSYKGQNVSYLKGRVTLHEKDHREPLFHIGAVSVRFSGVGRRKLTEDPV